MKYSISEKGQKENKEIQQRKMLQDMIMVFHGSFGVKRCSKKLKE